jgi:peptidoglycan/xylan/chitin deacetylase (PgdA/CDA1 family)
MNYLAQEGYETLSVDHLIDLISGEKSSGQKAVAITFDDGWLDNYLYAVPVLKRHNFKATFFVITSRVEAASTRRRLDSAGVPLHESAKKLIASGAAEQVALSWNMIKALEESGLFRFYSHTVTHRKSVDLLPLELQTELVDSKECIERKLDKGCDYLCWPYGSFSADTVLAAQDAGYKALFTTIDGFCESDSDPYMIKRLEVMNSVEWLKGRLSEGVK